jgi:hypothetical protein
MGQRYIPFVKMPTRKCKPAKITQSCYPPHAFFAGAALLILNLLERTKDFVDQETPTDIELREADG